MSIIKLLYTGLFGNNSNTADPKTLNIDGECSITNYDPRKGQKPEASVTVEAYNNSIFVDEGAKSDNTPDVADFSEKKAKMLEEVAGLDNTDSGLSKKDILKINENNKSEYIKKWGLTELKVDHNNFVLTLKWGDNDILRIDFSKKTKDAALQNRKEEPALVEAVKEEAKPAETETKPLETKDVPDFYVVKKGDTLSKIAQQYGLTLAEVLNLNKGLKPDMIKEGQKIILKTQENIENATQNQQQETHVVKSGEVLSKIAQKYGISLKDLMEANNIKNADSIREGQVLKLTKSSDGVGAVVNTTKTTTPEVRNTRKTVEIVPESTYTVKKGDNAVTLANKLGIPLSVLKAANKDKDLDKLSIGQVIKIPARKSVENTEVKSLEKVAELTGLSEYYIKEVLTKFEEKHRTVYDDGVGGGTLTVGYGHATRLLGKYFESGTKSSNRPDERFVLPKKAKNNSSIINLSDEEIYQILAQDLLNARAEAEVYFGKSFDKAPQEIQDAVIDIIFNKGVETGLEGYYMRSDGTMAQKDTPTRKLKDDLADRDYVSAVEHVIYGTQNVGLKKRNIYRAINSTRCLSERERKKAMSSLESYYNEVKASLSKGTAEQLEKAWNNAKLGIYEELNP